MTYKTVRQKTGDSMVHNKNLVLTRHNIQPLNDYIKFLRDGTSILAQRIKKQMSNIKNDTVRKTLKEDYLNCRRKNKGNIKPVEESDIGRKVGDVIDNKEFHNFRMCLIDYYLMARCFRSYNTLEGVKYSRPSYNNIIYAGNEHIGNYITILSKLGFKIDFQSVNYGQQEKDFLSTPGITDKQKLYDVISKIQCLDVSGMKQPMFYQRYTEDD